MEIQMIYSKSIYVYRLFELYWMDEYFANHKILSLQIARILKSKLGSKHRNQLINVWYPTLIFGK